MAVRRTDDLGNPNFSTNQTSLWKQPKTYTIALAVIAAIGAGVIAGAVFSRVPNITALNHSTAGYAVIGALGGVSAVSFLTSVYLHKRDKKSSPALPVGLEITEQEGVIGKPIDDLYRTCFYRCESVESIIDPRNQTQFAKVSVLATTSLGVFENNSYEGKTAILNFANAYQPGGAQEGSLRKASNEVLTQALNSFREETPKDPVGRYIHESHCLYTPKIPFKIEGKENPIELAVISAAAPNKNSAPYNNPAMKIRADFIMIQTVRSVLYAAAKEGVENLVLGAFGCGAFGWDPKTVADIFHIQLRDDFKGIFKNVIFAIPNANSANHKAFAEKFTNAHI